MIEMKTQQTSEPEAVAAIIKKLLVDTYLTAMHYAAGFSVEFAREGKPPDPTIPMIVRLTMRSRWWIGKSEEWKVFLQQAPMSYCGGAPDEPMMAYALMCLNGAKIEDVVLHEDSTLTLVTSLHTEIHCSGKDNVFEESWIIDVPLDVPNHALWSVVCSSTRELFGRQPESENMTP